MLAYDFDNIDRWLAIHQPALKIKNVGGKIVIDGTYELCYQSGIIGPQVFDSFQIEFVIPDNFPHFLPRVFETAKRIPRHSDNHINDDGSICFGVPSIISAKQPHLTVALFLDEILYDYFLGYLYFLTYQKWPFGEISHGYIGITEELAEILGCEPDVRKINALISLLAKKHRRDRWPCPCGSLKKLGNCCRPALNRASTKMSRSEAKKLIALSVRVKQRSEYIKRLTKVAQLEGQLTITQLHRDIAKKANPPKTAMNKKFGCHT